MRHLALALAALALVAACTPAAPVRTVDPARTPTIYVPRDPNWTPSPTPTCSEAIAELNSTLDLIEHVISDGIADQAESDRVTFYSGIAESQMAALERRGCV